MTSRTASCSCGQLRIQVDGEPLGVGICHCPTSNMTLASGQCRTKELEAAGCPVGLGVDGSASNDNSNLMESVRHALMINRLTYDAASVTHLDALRWASQTRSVSQPHSSR